MKKIIMSVLTIAVSATLLSGCSTHKKPRLNIVEGVIVQEWVDNQGRLNCQYRALGAGNFGHFTGIPPKEVGGCTSRAKINMHNEDITWIVTRHQNHIQYNN